MNQDDRLYQETDNTCALCGCRESAALTVHHIDGNHSNNVYENMIVLCHNCHDRHHEGKGITYEDITNQKRRLILRTITQYGLNAMKAAERNSVGVITPQLHNSHWSRSESPWPA